MSGPFDYFKKITSHQVASILLDRLFRLYNHFLCFNLIVKLKSESLTQPLSAWHTQRQFAAFLTSRICHDITLDSLQCFPTVPCTLPAFSVVNSQTLQCYCSTTLLIVQFLCDFVLQLVETAVCFTIYMIQHVFSIFIYSFNLWRPHKARKSTCNSCQ